MLQTATGREKANYTKKNFKQLSECTKTLLLIFQDKITVLNRSTRSFCRGPVQWQNVVLSEKVAIKIKTGQEEFLGGKLAVPNGRGD